VVVDGKASPLPFPFPLSLPPTSRDGLTKKIPGAILRGRTALGGTLTNNLGFWVTLECRVGSRVCMGL
jgi:hypothetical protein